MNLSIQPGLPPAHVFADDGLAPTRDGQPRSAETTRLPPQALPGYGACQPDGLPPPRAESGAAADGLDTALAAAEAALAADIHAFMLMYAKLVQEARNGARTARALELTQQVEALKSAAQELLSAAAQRFNAAIVAGTMQMAGGVLALGSAGMTLGKLSTPKGVTPPADKFTPGSHFMQGLMARQSLFTGSAQLMEGAGKLGSAGLEQNAAMADARAKEDDAEAAKAQAHRDTAQDLMQAMGDTLRDIRDKLAAILQSASEMNRGIARNV